MSALEHTVGRGWSRARQEDDGVASLEVVAILPVALLAIAAVVQLVFGIATVNAANDAARQAARAYSLGRSASAAAQDSLPGAMTLRSLSAVGPDHGIRLTVEVPRVVRILPQWTVTRTAVMP